jgi:hypothetical protein
MGAFGDAFSLYNKLHPYGFSKGGQISRSAAMKKKMAKLRAMKKTKSIRKS